MAASAFIYPNNQSTVAQVMTKFHELALTKGWELQHANTIAIGTGTATNPKWDATPALSTPAGIASYLMPLAGLTNRWVIQIEWAWGNSSPTAALGYTTTAQGVNTSTGALISPGRRNGWVAPSFVAGMTSLSVSEYGFAFMIAAQWHGVERRRSIGNVILDDLISHQFAEGGSTGFTGGARNVVRRWDTPEFGEDGLAFLAGFSTSSTSGVAQLSTLSSSDNNTGYPVGPLSNSNGLGGILRHVQCFRPNDSIASIDQSIEIDGQARLYFPYPVTGPGGLRTLIAKS
ncbi:hypothetical protein [Deinococcus sp. QL22]|uniref:hypothetical protein n=1 Tax=Deinococcus sp. QL22 TaxID=2939437 RepID=UPI002016B877|nr:hypothetical protein [Deinococcus sp. QL22]UQN06269.1 hypothetical protein M1R55_15635 [Deinococcus sp. QL22]